LTGQKIEIEGNFFNLLFAKVIAEDVSNNGIIVVIQDVTEQEELELMRKEFVANVSHELKTPITSIRGYSETLLENEMDRETEKNFMKE
jgi:two-component system sensor histidine kinase VicK